MLQLCRYSYCVNLSMKIFLSGLQNIRIPAKYSCRHSGYEFFDEDRIIKKVVGICPFQEGIGFIAGH